jgi:hypothetical protein
MSGEIELAQKTEFQKLSPPRSFLSLDAPVIEKWPDPR